MINIQLEKTHISARTPGHWRNRKVVESMPLKIKLFCNIHFILLFEAKIKYRYLRFNDIPVVGAKRTMVVSTLLL